MSTKNKDPFPSASNGIKCRGHSCPIRQECQRFMSPQKIRKQVTVTYFATTPYDFKEGRCKEFE